MKPQRLLEKSTIIIILILILTIILLKCRIQLLVVLQQAGFVYCFAHSVLCKKKKKRPTAYCLPPRLQLPPDTKQASHSTSCHVGAKNYPLDFFRKFLRFASKVEYYTIRILVLILILRQRAAFAFIAENNTSTTAVSIYIYQKHKSNANRKCRNQVTLTR